MFQSSFRLLSTSPRARCLQQGPRLQIAAAAVLMACLITGAPDADARRRRAEQGPVRIAVLDFEGMGMAGGVMRESLEIEFELLEIVSLQASGSVARGIVRGGRKAFEPRKLRAIMKKARIRALVQGMQIEDEAVRVVIYGADGRARFAQWFTRGDDIDELAAQIVKEATPVLNRFSSSKKVRIPAAPDGKSAQEVRDREPIDDGDLFVDMNDDSKKKKKKKGKRRRTLVDPVDEADTDEDEDEDGGRRAILGEAPDEDEEPTPRRRAKKKKKKKKKKRKSFSSDRGLSGSSSRKSFSKLNDDDDEVGETGGLFQPGPLTPLFSVWVAGEGGVWNYDFAAQASNASQSYGFNTYIGGASARVAFWPMQYFGVEVDIAGDYMPFKFEQAANPESAITPGEFWIPHLTAGAAARGRYIVPIGDDIGVGVGMRVGYRFDFAGTEPQTMGTGANVDTVTIIPGYMLHALVLGPEFFIPFKFGDNRGEVLLSTEIQPGLSRYEESPDNPGDNSLAFGGGAQFSIRVEVFKGVFVQGGVYGNLIYANYELPGDRLSPIPDELGQRVRLAGGTVRSINGGARVGFGYMF